MMQKAVAGLMLSVATCSALGAGPAWLDGAWSGTVFQPSIGSYPIDLAADASGETYSVTYPTLGCTTKWVLLSSTANKANFNEIVLSGASCIDGRVVVTKVVAGKYATYSFFLDASAVAAFTTMKRVPAQ
jgi:hypothetical protein